MLEDIKNLDYSQNLKRVRAFLICAAVSSPLFYYFMTRIDSTYQDFIEGRVLISVLCLIGLAATYLKGSQLKVGMIFLHVCRIVFLVVYLYLLYLNEWSVFHRWSYFVLAAIFCSLAMTWLDYVFFAALSLVGPLILGFFSPLTPIELLHFHAANLVTFGIIGISVHANFKYKNEVSILTNNLIEQSKMAALGEMAGGLSHEINNPLAIIKTSIDQMRRIQHSAEDKEKFDSLSEKINRMVGRINKVTSGLKDFSQDNIHQGLELYNLNEVIEDSISLCHSKFKSSETAIVFTPAAFEPLCLCKKNQIMQIILNLCTNSFEATRAVPNAAITVKIDKADDYYIISTTDNGVGVPRDIEQKIMEPFFTTKEVGKGLGLGLSVSHGFAKVHGGELLFEKDNNLTRFILKLPVPGELDMDSSKRHA